MSKSNITKSNLTRNDIKNLCQGRWLEILHYFGMDMQYLENKHGPCPFCGGVDRWRWDNKDGSGSGFCNKCDATGDGLHILGKLLNYSNKYDFPKLINSVKLFISPVNSPAIISTHKSEFIKHIPIQMAKKIWNSSVETKNSNNLAAHYLRNRGLKIERPFKCLRFHPSVDYYHDGKVTGKFPALIASITDFNNELMGIQRIYLDMNGSKANVQCPKKILGFTSRGSVKLTEPSKTLNIAEGIETALAVHEITNTATWAALSASNMQSLEIPNTVDSVQIWADLDQNQTGQKAAYLLQRKLEAQGIKTIIQIPQHCLSANQKSYDWLDELNRRNLKIQEGLL